MTPPMRPTLRFPDFLCIGAQKAGTTWLDANLRRHPGIWMPWIKELQYFNDVHIPAHRAWTRQHRLAHGERAAARVRRWVQAAGSDAAAVDRIQAMWGEAVSDEWYGRIFAHARADQVCGEVTPDYSLLPPEGIAHVKRLNPRMKIIFLMRDPVERCWSHLRMLARGREDFDYLAAARSAEVVARADYPGILRAWRAAFAEEQLVTAWIEDVAQEPEAWLRRVMAFLGCEWLPRAAAMARDRVHVGIELDPPAAVRRILEDRLGRIYEAIRVLPRVS
jgi:hypothetical protein